MKSSKFSTSLVFAGLILCGTPLLDSCSSTQPVKEQVSDSTITAKLKAKYMGDSDVKGRDISVETSEGVVYLTGRVSSVVEKEEAEKIAYKTEGVKKVVNNIKVGDHT